MSFQHIDPDPQLIENLKIRINIQNLQENALLIQMTVSSLPLLFSRFNDFLPPKIKVGLIFTHIICLIILQFCTEGISNKPFKYILFAIYLICKMYLIFILGRHIESFILVMCIAYLSVYCFLKTRDIVKGHNDLLVRYYLIHVIIISLITSLILVQELYFKIYTMPIYCIFMITYLIFLLFNLQLVEHRQYLYQNNDVMTICMLMDSDLIAPANLLKLQMGLLPPQTHQEIKKEEGPEDSDLDLESDIQE